MLKALVQKFLPPRVLSLYHLAFAAAGARIYRNPSNRMLVIGVTGTSGKSSTVRIMREIFEYAGFRVGALSTIEFYINGWQKLNDRKMTTLGRAQTQAFLRRMSDAHCDIAIIETTSQAALQHRHRFINYDIMLLTNLYPEHIEAHGGFENYKQAKIELFKYLALCAPKQWRGETFQKTAVLNGNSGHSPDFACAAAPRARVVYFGNAVLPRHTGGATFDEMFLSEHSRTTQHGIAFSMGGHEFQSPLYGEYNIMNVVASLAAARILGIEWKVLKESVRQLSQIPGHLEFIEEGQLFKVIVDYAFEPVAMSALYSTIEQFKPRRIIHVLGSTGGGRDRARRFTVGEFVARHAQYMIVTDEDPYDTPPEEIMRDVANAARRAGKQDGINLWQVPDRRKAIDRACELAQTGDIVLITGKGCEQAICARGGKKLPWDDRVQARAALLALGYCHTD